jgi:cellulose biosynthesis protein BcsQ
MNLITVFSQIGGVGKTTTATNLAYLLAQTGKQTLLLDLDTTGGATSVLNLPPAPRAFSWFTDDPIQPIISRNQVLTATQYPNLDLLPGNYRTEQITGVLAANRTPELATVNRLRALASPYAYTVADVTAAAGVLRDICINEAAYVLIPVHCAMRDIDALTGLMQTMPTKPGIIIVPTAYDHRKTTHRQLLAYLEKHYGGYLPINSNGEPWPVPHLTEIEHAAVRRRLVCDYAATGRISQAYRNLAAMFTNKEAPNE